MYHPFKEEKAYTKEEIKALAGENIVYIKDEFLKVLYGDRENFERIVFDRYKDNYTNLFEVSHREEVGSPFGDIYEEPSAYHII
jgi:hypothetical protein